MQNATTFAYFYTWSVLAQLNPYLEQTAIYNRMDLDLPFVSIQSGLNVLPENQFAVQQTVKLFLCPGDRMAPVATNAYGVAVLGPVNYGACTGSGATAGAAPYGEPWDADGVFRAAANTTFAEIADGLSNTAAFSESTLGDGPLSASGAIPGDPQRVYANVTTLTPAACDAATLWNVQQPRGYLWASGEVRCSSYNHHYPPNAAKYDCVANLGITAGARRYTAVGFKAARSTHAGGVNLLLTDGAVRLRERPGPTADLGGPRHPRRRRGGLRPRLLTPRGDAHVATCISLSTSRRGRAPAARPGMTPMNDAAAPLDAADRPRLRETLAAEHDGPESVLFDTRRVGGSVRLNGFALHLVADHFDGTRTLAEILARVRAEYPVATLTLKALLGLAAALDDALLLDSPALPRAHRRAGPPARLRRLLRGGPRRPAGAARPAVHRPRRAGAAGRPAGAVAPRPAPRRARPAHGLRPRRRHLRLGLQGTGEPTPTPGCSSSSPRRTTRRSGSR